MKSIDKLITSLFYVVLFITAIWDYFFRGGEKLGRIGLIMITILGLLYIFRKTFLKDYLYLYYVALFFVFIAMYLANVFDFYSFQYYDKFLHLLSGVILSVIGFTLYIYLSNNSLENGMKKESAIIFSLIFSIACAGLWEIWEFATDQIFGLTAQINGLQDTMWDMICGTIGSIITCSFIHFSLKNKSIEKITGILGYKLRDNK